MTLEQIKAAVESGQRVCWKNDAYEVKKDSVGQWLIICSNGHCIGLTWRDGVTMNGKPEDFYVDGVCLACGAHYPLLAAVY